MRVRATSRPGFGEPARDQEILRDYKSVLAPGAVIAGPAALDLKSGILPGEAVHWLKANFFKTELELGHCLRLPAEGPASATST